MPSGGWWDVASADPVSHVAQLAGAQAAIRELLTVIDGLQADRVAIDAALNRYRSEVLPGVWLAMAIDAVLHPNDERVQSDRHRMADRESAYAFIEGGGVQ